MKILITAITILISTKASIAAESSKCSQENFEKLLNLSAKIIGELGQSQMATSKLFSSKDFEKMNSQEIKAKYNKIKDDQNKKTMPAIEELTSFAKAHPECDKNYNFRLKGE